MPISRDTFDKTKHYDKVVFNKDKFLVDAELNEAQDIQRKKAEAIVKAIGDGSPDAGFRITGAGMVNDFLIDLGTIFAKGIICRKDVQESYRGQVDYPGAPALTAPGANRDDVVYLHIYEEAVDEVADPNLVDPTLAVPTAGRVRLRFRVEVAEGGAMPADDATNKYALLGKITRYAGVSIIQATDVLDQRAILQAGTPNALPLTGGTLTGALSAPEFIASVLTQEATNDGNLPRVQQTLYSDVANHTNNLKTMRAGGTKDIPTPTPVNAQIMTISGRGFAAGAFSAGANAAMRFVASELHTAIAKGVHFVLELTPIGSTVRAEVMRILGDGSVGIGKTPNGYKLDVNGQINATGINVNGQPLSASDGTKVLKAGDTMTGSLIVQPAGSTNKAVLGAGSSVVLAGPTIANASGNTQTALAAAWSPTLNLFAAVGPLQTIYTSPDGNNWTARTALATATWCGMMWCAEKAMFVVVGAAGMTYDFAWSTDGINWTGVASGTGIGFRGVCYSASLGKFVAVGDAGNGRVATSPDGKVWTAGVLDSTNAWRDVAWVPQIGRFVAISTAAWAWSTDGITWNVYASVIGGAVRLAVSTDGHVVTVNSTQSASSIDGANWTVGAIPTANTALQLIFLAAYNSFLSASSAGYAVSSDGGYTWTSTAVALTATNGLAFSPSLNMVITGHAAGVMRFAGVSGVPFVYGQIDGKMSVASLKLATGLNGAFLQTDALGNVTLQAGSDPLVRGVVGLVKSDGANPSAAIPGTDYATPAQVISDHGNLTGLGDDDHSQYLNNARGDARYVQAGYRLLPLPTGVMTASGTFVAGVAGEMLDKGSVVYMKADGKYWKANAAAAATTPAIGIVSSGVALVGDPIQVMTYGLWSNSNLTWTPGWIAYLTTFAGGYTPTKPSAVGEQVQILGVAVSPSVILFNPNMMVVGL